MVQKYKHVQTNILLFGKSQSQKNLGKYLDKLKEYTQKIHICGSVTVIRKLIIMQHS